MKQDVALSGQHIALRLARHEDAHFLFTLRQQANRDNTVHQVADYSSHEAWFARYHTRSDDYLFVAEKLSDHAPQGTIALVQVDLAQQSAEIGRWLMLPGSKSGVEAALLAYRIAFEQLHISTLFARVMARNIKVVRFHLYIGWQSLGALAPEVVDGTQEEMMNFRIDHTTWSNVLRKLTEMASVLH